MVESCRNVKKAGLEWMKEILRKPKTAQQSEAIKDTMWAVRKPHKSNTKLMMTLIPNIPEKAISLIMAVPKEDSSAPTTTDHFCNELKKIEKKAVVERYINIIHEKCTQKLIQVFVQLKASWPPHQPHDQVSQYVFRYNSLQLFDQSKHIWAVPLDRKHLEYSILLLSRIIPV